MNLNCHVVVINGLGGSGKSTFIQHCYNVSDLETSVIELSTVDYVKEVARFCGWNGGKTESDRIFLSDIKKSLEKWNDSPMKSLYKEIEDRIAVFSDFNTMTDRVADPISNVIFFINSREPKDIERIRRYCVDRNYTFMTLHVVNTTINSNEVPELVNGINTMKYDMTITNNGSLDELKQKAVDFINILTRKNIN